jgi:hypothetical protein
MDPLDPTQPEANWSVSSPGDGSCWLYPQLDYMAAAPTTVWYQKIGVPLPPLTPAPTPAPPLSDQAYLQSQARLAVSTANENQIVGAVWQARITNGSVPGRPTSEPTNPGWALSNLGSATEPNLQVFGAEGQVKTRNAQPGLNFCCNPHLPINCGFNLPFLYITHHFASGIFVKNSLFSCGPYVMRPFCASD